MPYYVTITYIQNSMIYYNIYIYIYTYICIVCRSERDKWGHPAPEHSFGGDWGQESAQPEVPSLRISQILFCLNLGEDSALWKWEPMSPALLDSTRFSARGPGVTPHAAPSCIPACTVQYVIIYS